MSGRFTPTSESSAADNQTDIPDASIGTFVINVLCDNPKFNEDVLVIVDEESGIDKATEEFRDNITRIAQKASCICRYWFLEVRLFIPDDDGNGSIIVSTRQLMQMIWCLPRAPGLIKPRFFSKPNSNRIHVTLKKGTFFPFCYFCLAKYLANFFEYVSDISKHLVPYPAYFPSFIKIYRLYQYFHVSDTSDWEALDSFFCMFFCCMEHKISLFFLKSAPRVYFPHQSNIIKFSQCKCQS
ncbi:hypothetical protein FPQ18DRAFT_354467 [Pyronema domesticum]|nr:hypothetical protein FPQ18DRAFT_354467 [Pyronema domesticum]